jgi:hypothetical protein
VTCSLCSSGITPVPRYYGAVREGQHDTDSVHKASSSGAGDGLGQLAGAPAFACDLAEVGRCGCEGCTGADAALACDNHSGGLSAVHYRVSATGGEQADTVDGGRFCELSLFQNLVPKCSNIRAEKVDEDSDKGWRINGITTAAFGPEKAGVGGSTPSLATIFSRG